MKNICNIGAYYFGICKNFLNSVNLLLNFKTDNVTDMSGMFRAMYSIKDLDVSFLNIQKATDI